VLAGLEALSQLSEGSLVVVPDKVSVKGVAGSQSARGRISQILSGKLGQGQSFTVDVRYDVERDPDAAPPPPEDCAADINTILSAGKISFAPGSAEISGSAMPTIAAIAEVLEDCPGIAMEIAGHTDSQGSEGGNQALSQARADAVLVALQGRRVDVSGMTAVGYGEAVPIADNGGEAGRETNRRIEFTLKDAPATAANGTTEDTRPSVAPTEATVRPRGRPERE
jgi:OmpA-OmpF porin, OOP family